MKDSLVYQVNQLLKLNQFSIDKEELDFQIKSHPSYPSLHAITGVLDHFNISNVALDVPATEEVLSQLPKSFLAQIKTEKGNEFVVVANKGLSYDIYSKPKKKSKKTLNEFLIDFTGIIVAVESDEKEQNNNVSSNIFKNSIILLSVLLFGLHLYFLNPTLYISLFFVLSAIGIFISTSIFKQELGEESFLGNAFCSSNNDKKSCDAVLTSKGASIFKTIKLSDLSIIYFSGLAIATYILLLLNTDISYAYVISALAIPVTLYSIYHQFAVVKKWCLLCLSIVAVLWLQFAIAFINFSIINDISINNLFAIAFAFSLPSTLWYFVSPNIKNQKEFRQTKIDFIRFKRNFNLFNALLEKSKIIDTEISNVSEIVFGNTKSPLNITLITNPFCRHCKAVHTLVEDIINSHRDNVKITVRINANTKNKESDLLKITTRLIEIYHIKGQETCLEAMHDVYGDASTTDWYKKWGICKTPEIYKDTIEKQSEWSKRHNINFTPEILINGKSFPKEYNRQDLIYFVEDLEENCCQEANTVSASFS